MQHITHSGYYAGLTWCGDERNEEDTYGHYGYTWVNKFQEAGKLCPKCWEVYLESLLNEDDDEA